jgi:hypothetical protein
LITSRVSLGSSIAAHDRRAPGEPGYREVNAS